VFPEMLRRKNDLSITAEELNKIGGDAYRREFGFPVSGRWISELFTRTLKRAGASEDFSSLELYLPDRFKPKAVEKPKAQSDIPELAGLLEAHIEPATQTPDARELIWENVAEYFNEQISAGESAREVRCKLLDFVFAKAGWLCDSREALDKTFSRKLKYGTQDKRRVSRKLERGGLSEADWQNGVHLARCYENIDLAFREWRDSEKTSAEAKERFGNVWRAPKIWRDAIQYDAKIASILKRGSRTYKLNSAHNTTDPNRFASGDVDMSDDLTLPILWWDELPNGEIFCGQGQFLAWLDARSWFYYGGNLIPSGSYNGFNIRNSWTGKAEKWGLPRKYIHTEMGIWREAKVFAGTRKQVGTRVAETGLRRLGVKFRNSVLPRGKYQVERFYGSFQDLLHLEHGYCGRNRMLDKWEQVESNLKLVKSGKEHPSKFFLHKSQLIERLNYFGEKLNNTPKRGKDHLSKTGIARTPKEVYQDCFTTPLVFIPDELRYQLAENMVDLIVGRNGITFRHGARTFNYKNYRTGQLRGQRVKAWFSPENPELLGVTDLKDQNPFVVKRSTTIALYDESPELLAQANRENSEHNAYGKELVKMLKPYFDNDFQKRMFRPTIVDAETLETAQEFRRQRNAIQTEETEQRSLTTRARRASEKVGFPVAPERMEDAGAADELEYLDNWAKGKK
ncbi:MAG: hypothetical protein ABIR24_14340, partial [Verrucomicrobiota bacterium]